MLRVLAIGDPHFKSDNGDTTEDLTEKVVILIKERLPNLNAVVVLGDILHRHEKIDLHPLHRAGKFLERIHDAISDYPEVYLYIIVGNHDRSNNRVFMTDEHAFNSYKKWKNTFVADKALLHYPLPGFKVLLMPYVPPGRFQEAYESVISELDLDNTVDVVFAHQEFHGAKMNLITSNEGDPWNSLKPLCVSGHIHDYQILKGNLIYTGTPIQHGFADVGKKTVSIYTLSKPDNTRAVYSEERIDLKIKGRITVKGDVTDFDSLEFPTGEFLVKAKLHGTKRSIKTFTESKKYLDAVERGIVFQFLELPAIIIEDTSLRNPSNITEMRGAGGKTFSERLRETLEGLRPDIKDEFAEVFYKS